MISDIQGKKLLILAGSVHEVDLVKRAKELGVYTIVTDYYSIDDSPAKRVADEYWNISWSDIDALEKKCTEEHVDGVTAGYSESTVECLIELCERLNLPCYCTKEQLSVLRDKSEFKKTCISFGVPTVKGYDSIVDVTHFPVIVKPVDRGGSIGVGIANNSEELSTVFDFAMDQSYSKQVIIEDYIDGIKFDVYYAIIDGKITFLSSSDTVDASNNNHDKVVQSGWLLPSKYESLYLNSVDSKMRDMISGLKLTNGFIFVSGFFVDKGFVFFESGFRLSGGHLYKFFEEIGFPNIQDLFILHALNSKRKLKFDVNRNDDLRALVINYYAKEGRLTTMGGLEELRKVEHCKFVLPMCSIGTDCYQDKAILTKLCMVHLYSDNIEVLINDLRRTNSLFAATDRDGNDMVYDRMNEETVKSMME